MMHGIGSDWVRIGLFADFFDRNDEDSVKKKEFLEKTTLGNDL
jgi:hypothetical protein